MTQTIRRPLTSPTGWLVSPKKDFVLLFIRDPKSLMRMPNVLTQLWYSTKQGIPSKLKNTRKMNYESALETWNELLSNGWKLIDYQIT